MAAETKLKTKREELDSKYDVSTKYTEYAKKKEAYKEEKGAELAQRKIQVEEMRASASARADELDAQYHYREKTAALAEEAAVKKAVATAKAAELDDTYQISAKKDALKERAMANSRFSKGMARFAERKLAAAESLAEFQVVASVSNRVATNKRTQPFAGSVLTVVCFRLGECRRSQEGDRCESGCDPGGAGRAENHRTFCRAS